MSTTLKHPPARTRAQIQARAQTLLGVRPARAAAPADAAADRAADGGDAGGSESGTTGELWLYGVVGGWWRGFDAESVANALRGMDVDNLVVRLHSPGGLATEGVAIGNLLRNHRAKVTVVVDGLAASAASVIAVGGDTVVMCPGSQMMLHDASTFGFGNAADLRKTADWLDGQSQNYAGVYVFKAGGTDAQWRTVMLANDGDGTWYTAQGAVDAGLADEVGTRTAVGSPPTAPEEDFSDEDTWARMTHDLAILEQCVSPAARAVWNGKHPTKLPAGPSAPGSTEKGSAVTQLSDQATTTLRQKLGITAEDADEATIMAALDEALEERTEPAAPTNSTVPPGHVVVPEARLRDLEAGATAGRQAAEALHVRERKEFLDANARKFATTNRAAWEAEYDRDPEGTRAHFAAAPDIIPVNEVGHSTDASAEDATDEVTSLRESDAYKNWSL